MPMPDFDTRDYEYMEHPIGTPAFGDHSAPQCGAKSKRGIWTCTRKAGHMGRHEAGVSGKVEYKGEKRTEIVASWADKPE